MPKKKNATGNKTKAEAIRKLRQKIKANPEAHAAYLQKEKERYQKRKREGKIQQINNLSEKEQRLLRRKWKKDKRKQRKEAKEKEQDLHDTPPPSPDSVSLEPQPSTSQKKVGRRKVKREERKCYRKLARQTEQIRKLTNKVRVLQRKLQRKSTCPKSPASKAEALISAGNVEEIRKELLFSFAVEAEMKIKLQDNMKKHKEKRALYNAVVGSITRKYRLLQQAKEKLRLSQRQIQNVKQNKTAARKRKDILNGALTLARNFFLRDDNSAPAAGKKDTKTLHKDKRQKRFLCDSMKNLFQKFKCEHPHSRISYTSFTRQRPFFVIPPSVDARDTVKCKVHANMELKSSKLFRAGILKSADATTLIESVVCSSKQKDCMYFSCSTCKDKIRNIYKDESKITNEEITYLEWATLQEKRQTNKGEITVNISKKIEKKDTIANLCSLFEEKFPELMSHEYRIFHQFHEIRHLKSTLHPNECALQVDFSENYQGKAVSEIQSMHFGASRPQISLHTCHATMRNAENFQTKCYCTVSDDTRHSPASIWAHLKPVMLDLKSNGIDTLHFISDGPTSQYRNRTNFHVMSTFPFDLGFTSVTWTLLEASHGKGPADGIGAVVKQAADRAVAHGTDVLSVSDLLAALSNIKVQLYSVSADNINTIASMIEGLPNIPSIKGTLKIHQLLVPARNRLYHRQLSCYCSDSRFCVCHGLTDVNLPSITNPTAENPAVCSIEAKLSPDQLSLFKRRLDEGYDVTVNDLSTLDPAKRSEYIYWTAWRAAKLSLNESPDDIDQEDDDISRYSSEESEDDLWLPPEQNSKAVDVGKFYAVFFLQKRKKTFYLGTPVTRSHKDAIEMKFLEKKLIKSKFVYDWPKHDDICSVDKKAILEEVTFKGPPPFHLDDKKIKMLSEKANNFEAK